MSTSPKAPLRAAIYVRVSKNREDDHDNAKPERQIKKCELLAEAREYRIVQTHDKHGNPCHYVDDDVSAYSGKKRPRYEEMLEAVRGGKLDVILALHMDRLLRSMDDMSDLIKLAREKGAAIATVQSGDLDLGTAAGRLVANMLAAVAQAESERKAERHFLRNEAAAAQGLPVGMAGFGYGTDVQKQDKTGKPIYADDGTPVTFRKETGKLHETEGPLLRDAIERIIAGESVHSICVEWNRAGIKTRHGNKWAHTQLRRVLLRPRNAGYVERHKKILDGVKGQWTAVCTPEEFAQLKARLRPNMRKREPRKHMLTGLLSCARCGHAMEAAVSSRFVKGRRYAYKTYRCGNANGLGRFCGISVRAEVTEMYVVHAVRQRLAQEGAEGSVMGTKDLKEAVRLREERDGLYGRLDAIESLMAAGEYSVPKFRKVRSEIEAEIATIEARVAEIEAENALAKMVMDRAGAISNFKDAAELQRRFKTLSLDERRHIIRSLFKRIEVTPFDGNRDPLTRLHFTDSSGRYFPMDLGDPYADAG